MIKNRFSTAIIVLLLILIVFSINNCKKSKKVTNITKRVSRYSPSPIKSKNINKKIRPLIFGITPHDNRAEMVKRYRNLVDYLSEKLGRKIVLSISRCYDEIGKNLNDGNIDFAIISPTAYVKSKIRYPKLQYLATVKNKRTGRDHYYGYIFVRKDSGIKNYKDLKGKVFAFVDRASGSGYIFPVAMMIKKWRLNSISFFKSSVFLGNHRNIIRAVFQRQVDAGATWETPLYEEINKFHENPFRILLKSPPIPFDAFTASPLLDKSMLRKIKSILLSINKNSLTRDGRSVLKEFYYSGFVIRNNSFYNIIRNKLKCVSVWKKQNYR